VASQERPGDVRGIDRGRSRAEYRGLVETDEAGAEGLESQAVCMMVSG
jgi:hypothetical protein